MNSVLERQLNEDKLPAFFYKSVPTYHDNLWTIVNKDSDSRYACKNKCTEWNRFKLDDIRKAIEESSGLFD